MRLIALTCIATVGVAVAPLRVHAECFSCGEDIERAVALMFYGAFGLLALVFFLLRWRKTAAVLVVVPTLVAFGLPLSSQISQRKTLQEMKQREVWSQADDPFLGTPVLLSEAGAVNCHFSACDSIIRAAGPSGILVFSLEAEKALDTSGSTDLATLSLERWVYRASGFVVSTPLTSAEVAAVAPSIDRLIVIANTGAWSRHDRIETMLALNPALKDLPQKQVVNFALAPLEKPGQINLQALKFDILDLFLVGEREAAPLWLARSSPIDNSLSKQAESVVRTAICTARPLISEADCLKQFG